MMVCCLRAAFRSCVPPLFLALAPCAVAQTALVLEGDPFPGADGKAEGSITTIDNLVVNNAGEWLVEVDSDLLDTSIDAGILRNGTLYLREGQSIDFFSGATIAGFDSISLTTAGDVGMNFFLDNVGGASDSVIFFNSSLVMQEGFVSRSLAFSPETRYLGYSGVVLNDVDQYLLVASVDDPAIPSPIDRALVVLSYDRETGSFVESVLFKEGDLLPGQTEVVVDFGTGPHECAFNNAGDVLFCADLAGDPSADGVIFLNATLVAQEGADSPVKGRKYDSLAGHALALNNAGTVVFKARLSGDASSDQVIVKDNAVLVQEGDVLDAVAPFTLESTGLPDGPVAIADTGAVLWYADWTDPDTSRDTGLFVDDELIVREGVTLINGMTVTAIANGQDAFTISPNGRFVIFEATLDGEISGAFLVDLGAPRCRADWNGDRVGNSQDLFDYLTDFFDNAADFNEDGITNSQDFFDYLAAFFVGC